MGNAHPSVFPYEPLPTADDDLIVAAANDRQFRKLCEVLGIPEVADDPRFARNVDRTANRERAAPAAGRAAGRRGAVEWFELLVDGGRAVRTDQHHRRRVRDGRALRARPGRRRSARATGPCPPPATRSGSPRRPARYRLPPPELDEHGAELRKWLPRRRRTTVADLTTPPRWAPPAWRRSPCSARTWPRTSWARSGSASWPSGWPPSAARARRDAGVRGRARRAGRPRLHPDRDRHPADLPVRAGLRAGRAGGRAARRRLPVPRRHRGLRTLPARRARAARRAARRRRRLGRAGARAPSRTQRAARQVRARAGPPRAQGRRPAHARG